MIYVSPPLGGAVLSNSLNQGNQFGSSAGPGTPPPPAFLPSDVSGLKLWLDASDGAKLYTDTGLTTLVSADGNSVKGWKDKTASANNLTEATNAPTYKTAIIGTKSVVRFDGVNDVLNTSALASTIITNTALSMWVVGRVVAYTTDQVDAAMYGNGPFWNCAHPGNGSNLGLFCKTTGSVVSAAAYTNTQNNAKQTGVTAATAVVIHMRLDTNHLVSSKNNGTEVSTTYTGNPDITNDFIRLANNYAPAFANIDIGEMLFYNVVVGSTDRTSIQTYLNTRWAVY